jgi:glycogen synthase
MKASVVINTYNRAAHLNSAIRSIAAQSFPEVELIVVNGPSTDETEQVLDALPAEGYRFKRMRCNSRNLSESRNIGIAASSGDVVFFIDDDGVAHPRWVERLMRQYQDCEVGAAGGFTLDHTGMGFQCRYTVCNRLGDAFFMNALDPATLLAHGPGLSYPSLLGTNSSFRRSDLEAIGGFDEVYAYMLDETDVCLRIYETGKRIVTVPDALVLHKYAPSHSRNAERIPRSILASVRSKSYFMLKHAVGKTGSLSEVYAKVETFHRDMEFSNRWLLDHGKISVSHYATLSKELRDGIAEGIALAGDVLASAGAPRLLGPGAPKAAEFLPIRGDKRFRLVDRPLRLYMVSQGYPPDDTAGIARWTHECAKGLSELGHEVHVLTRSTNDTSHVDYIDGIWVHRLVDTRGGLIAEVSTVPLPASILGRAEAVLNEIRRCIPIWGVDIVSAPIWDLEGILCAEVLDVPVVTSLHTTYQLALPFKPAWTRDREYRIKHVNRVIAGERWLLKNSAAVLANSLEIVREIEATYDMQLDATAENLRVVYHGVGHPPALSAESAAAPEGGAAPVRILFVGRVEERKGPDVLLDALLRLPQEIAPLHVEFIGQEPGEGDEFALRVRAAARQLLESRPGMQLKFRGYVDDAALEAAYRECDIFVAPSRFESFGLILIEAMRWGKPVVASDIGGMREVVLQKENGLLAAPGSSEDLAEALLALISDAGLRHRLGQQARQTYETRFTQETMVRGLSAFFLDVVAKRRLA